MAKKTKDSNLSLEEKLEQALIPNWDEPYKLPDNWCWVNLKSVLRHQSGNSKLIKGKLNSEKGNGLFDAYSASGQDVYTEFYEHEGDAIIVSAVGARCGKAFLATGKWSAIANTHIIYSNDDLIDIRYLYYILNDESWWVRSGSAQPFVVVNESLSRAFALPPLSEQHRIVARIESLFAKLDEAKEKAQEVVDGFETCKAAILHKAFSGELTQKWREENGVGLDSWKISSIDELCHSLKYGTSKKSKSEGPVVVIRMGNLQQGEIDWTDLAYTDDQEDIEKYKLNPGDVLFNRTNSAVLVGKTSIYRGEYPAIFAGYLIKLDYDHERILGEYLNYSLNTTAAKEYCNSVKTDGVNQSNINAKKIGAFEIPVAPFSEQIEIVRIIKSLLEKENQSKETAETVIEQIDTMKKAILARAFRGELGTNDPSEESAVELLKKMLDTALKPKKPMKRVAIPKSLDHRIKTDLERKIIKLYIQNDTDILPINLIMGVSSKKFEIIEALRNLQQRELLEKQNDNYKLLG